MQNDVVEFFISFGYPKAMQSIMNVISTRNDVQIYSKKVDESWGCGDFCLRGSWDAYKELLNISEKFEDPECWFSIEHFEDDIV